MGDSKKKILFCLKNQKEIKEFIDDNDNFDINDCKNMRKQYECFGYADKKYCSQQNIIPQNSIPPKYHLETKDIGELLNNITENNKNNLPIDYFDYIIWHPGLKNSPSQYRDINEKIKNMGLEKKIIYISFGSEKWTLIVPKTIKKSLCENGLHELNSKQQKEIEGDKEKTEIKNLYYRLLALKIDKMGFDKSKEDEKYKKEIIDFWKKELDIIINIKDDFINKIYSEICKQHNVDNKYPDDAIIYKQELTHLIESFNPDDNN